MDTDVAEHSRAGTAPVIGSEAAAETPEATIDEVDGLLDEVEAALTRLDEGTYGTCGGCGTAIDDARLAGDPTTLTCGACDAGAPQPAQDDAVIVGRVDSGDAGADDDPVAAPWATPGDVEASDEHSSPGAEPGRSWD